MELRLLVSTAKDIVVSNAKAIYIVVSNAKAIDPQSHEISMRRPPFWLFQLLHCYLDLPAAG